MKKNKIVILVVFLIILVPLSYNFLNQKKLETITHEKAKEIVSNIFQDEYIEEVEDGYLVLTKNNNYMVMVVSDQYLLFDFSSNPPKIHQFTSNKPDIQVKVLEIHADKYLVEHDDHTHWVNGQLDTKVKVGDLIYIKDPHTYLQDNHEHKH